MTRVGTLLPGSPSPAVLLRRLGSVGVLTFGLVATTSRASAESHELTHDVRVVVEPDGAAIATERVSVRLAGTMPKSLEISGLPPGAVPEKETTFTMDDGTVVQADVELVREGAVKVTPLDARAARAGSPLPGARAINVLRRGAWTFTLRYRVDLLPSGLLTPDGALLRLRWPSPPIADGVDGVRAVFAFPLAPTEPRPVEASSEAAEPGPSDGVVLTALRRTTEHDELELTRPHVARGEAPIWTVRLDPRALPAARAGLFPQAIVAPPPPRARSPFSTPVALGLGLLIGLIAALKARAVLRVTSSFSSAFTSSLSRDLEERTGRAAPWLRGALATLTFGGGILLQLRSNPLLGSGVVGASLLVVAFRPRVVTPRPRGPGRWLPLRVDEAFASPRLPIDAFDVGAALGRGLLAALLLTFVAVALVLAREERHGPYFVILDALVLVPLFATGRRVQLPPSPATAGPFLHAVHRRLATALEGRSPAPRVTPWARVPTGGFEPDELRLLLVAPPKGPSGLVGIEVGLAWAGLPSGPVGLPEVLVRVAEGSEADLAMTRIAPQSRAVPGRQPQERVHVFRPSVPTARATAARARGLLEALCDAALVERSRLADTTDAGIRRPPPQTPPGCPRPSPQPPTSRAPSLRTRSASSSSRSSPVVAS